MTWSLVFTARHFSATQASHTGGHSGALVMLAVGEQVLEKRLDVEHLVGVQPEAPEFPRVATP